MTFPESSLPDLFMIANRLGKLYSLAALAIGVK